MPDDVACDYVVVGSGAGGGTLAARLAEAGMRVVVLEAGGDPRADAPRMPEDYDVPAFHPFASENPAITWNFFVRHYADAARQGRDPKCGPHGVLYPRAGTLGGCTAHNAMILMRPHASDLDGIAALTGDASWQAARMERYWQRLENCRHRPIWRRLARLGLDPTGHGWNGWLSAERAKPLEAMADVRLVEAVLGSAVAALAESPEPGSSLWRLFETKADPNDRRNAGGETIGLCYTPLATDRHRRTGARERLREVAARHPDRLRIELHALATRVLLDDANRAVGVEYLKGEHLYGASPLAGGAPGELRAIRPAREVILAGGAFNTPQLLMLSGIGARADLSAHGIAVRVDLPGVGRNLQDRYEVAVVNRMARSWQALAGARFEKGDPQFAEWAGQGRGMYVSNGAALAVTLASAAGLPAPDLFCMALLARFEGYYPGYSQEIAAHHDYLSWAILKAHTGNRAGVVALRSADPRQPPAVDFHYFDEGNDPEGADLAAVVKAVRFARGMTEKLRQRGLIAAEELPGPDVQTDDAVRQFVRDTAWGHHASCSCAIGPRSAEGVLDSDFRVHGTHGLRVADASVFPRIPGFFIAGAVYMVGEKAADAVLRDAAGPSLPAQPAAGARAR